MPRGLVLDTGTRLGAPRRTDTRRARGSSQAHSRTRTHGCKGRRLRPARPSVSVTARVSPPQGLILVWVKHTEHLSAVLLWLNTQSLLKARKFRACIHLKMIWSFSPWRRNTTDSLWVATGLMKVSSGTRLLGMIQSMNSAKIKNSDQEQINPAV